MRVVALWYGGSSYAVPDPTEHLEHFDSLAAARRSFASRVDFDPFYPCVDETTTEMHVYIGTDYHENGPDRILTIGKRGAVRTSRY